MRRFIWRRPDKTTSRFTLHFNHKDAVDQDPEDQRSDFHELLFGPAARQQTALAVDAITALAADANTTLAADANRLKAQT